jgi:uncharacterized protein YjbI with pentapeptide repeats
LKIQYEDLQKIIGLHNNFVLGEKVGESAALMCIDLYGVNLASVNLKGANLEGASLMSKSS